MGVKFPERKHSVMIEWPYYNMTVVLFPSSAVVVPRDGNDGGNDRTGPEDTQSAAVSLCQTQE